MSRYGHYTRKEDPSQREPANKTDGTSPTGIARSEDSGADGTGDNTVACAMDDDRGHGDEPVAREGHDVPTGVVQHGVEEVVETAIARNAKYPFHSSCQGSEIFPPRQGNLYCVFPPRQGNLYCVLNSY